MSLTTDPLATQNLEISNIEQPKVKNIQIEAEIAGDDHDSNTTACEYTFSTNPKDQAEQNDPLEDSIPIIDFSLLTSSSPDQRSKIVHDIRTACENWSCFTLINHGVPESMTKLTIDTCWRFFCLSDEEKEEFLGCKYLDPVVYGTGYDVVIDDFHLWRDYVKFLTHPEFHLPPKLAGFSDILEFTKRIREIAREIMKGISESLGLEKDHIEKAMNWDEGLQTMTANYYPACPQPNLAMGSPEHTDPSLVAFLVQNGINGLQLQHKGKWVNWNPSRPNALIVILTDQMEVLSNGTYKSVLHRSYVNTKAARISIAVLHGPSLDTVVVPSPKLLEREGQAPAYAGISYREFLDLMQSSKSYKKPPLEHLRI